MKGAFLMFFCLCFLGAYAQNDGLAGVWLTDLGSDAMSSYEQLDVAFRKIKDKGYNTVFPVVWKNGNTLFPSTTMEIYFGFDGRTDTVKNDVLGDCISLGLKHGLLVIPSFDTGFASEIESANRVEILKNYPQWAARNSKGKTVLKDSLQWMNSFDPEVQEFLSTLVLEVVDNYEIDGIQCSGWLPASPVESGYDTHTVELYKLKYDCNPPSKFRDEHWIQFRADRLTEWLDSLVQEIRTRNPFTKISVAPRVYPHSKNEYLQDWPSWLEKGLIDYVHPQIYCDDIGTYQDEIDKIVSEQIAEVDLVKLSPGLLFNQSDYQLSSEIFLEIVSYNRKVGVDNESVVYYGFLDSQDDKKRGERVSYLPLDKSIASHNVLSKPKVEVDHYFFTNTAIVEVLPGPEGTVLEYSLNGGAFQQVNDHKFVALESSSFDFRFSHPYFTKSQVTSVNVIRLSESADVKIELYTEANANYKSSVAILSDQQKGGFDFRNDRWLGFDKGVVELKISLDVPRNVKSISVSALVDQGNWIFSPSRMIFTSSDGRSQSIIIEDANIEKENYMKILRLPIDMEVRSGVLKIESLDKIPEWHTGKGTVPWIFVDEIIVE